MTPNSSPAAAPRAVVVDNLIEMREHAVMLQTILQESPTPPSPAAGELMVGIMSRLSTALSALNTGAGPSSEGGRAASGRRSRQRGVAAAGPGPHRRTSGSRRRSGSPFCKTVTTNTLDDGNTWRKYGQKQIQDFPNNPRSYYRCTHRQDQGCRATRQVQTSEANPSEFVIHYFGEHTCRDPSAIPLVIDAGAAPLDGANLISFGTTIAGAATGTQYTAADPTMMLSRFVVGYSSSLPAPARSGSEGVLSSSSPAGYLASVSSVVGTAGTNSSATVGSAPEYYWPDMMAAGGIGAGSLPSSPSSLGFMPGSFESFGNAGDDDLFGLDL